MWLQVEEKQHNKEAVECSPVVEDGSGVPEDVPGQVEGGSLGDGVDDQEEVAGQQGGHLPAAGVQHLQGQAPAGDVHGLGVEQLRGVLVLPDEPLGQEADGQGGLAHAPTPRHDQSEYKAQIYGLSLDIILDY